MALSRIKSFLSRILPQKIYLLLRKGYAYIANEICYIWRYRVFHFKQNNYYDDYWSQIGLGKENVFRLKRIQAIIRVLGPGGWNVLDLGCGDGNTLAYLRDGYHIASGVGVDVSNKAIAFARKRGIKAIKGDVTDINFIKTLSKFDYIMVSELIEHIPQPEELLIGLKGKFTKGLIISIPNSGYIRYRLRLLFGKFPMQWKVFPGEHLRFWTYKDFSWWVKNLGYQVETSVCYEGIPVLKNIWKNLFGEGLLFLLKEKK